MKKEAGVSKHLHARFFIGRIVASDCYSISLGWKDME